MQLREFAKALKIRGATQLKKAELVEMLLEFQRNNEAAAKESSEDRPSPAAYGGVSFTCCSLRSLFSLMISCFMGIIVLFCNVSRFAADAR